VHGLIEEVESWDSWHSLDDYRNNIFSIKNAYYGGLDLSTPVAMSLSVYVAGKDAALDNRIKAKITDCLTKIAAIGTGGRSFYEVVRDNAKK
jgi:Holliday junction resolvase RusA-like endonuclease